MNQYGSDISAEGRDLLNHVTDAAQRMNRLIVDLLAFCQATQHSLKVGPVQTVELVRRAAATVTAAATPRNIDLRIAELPACVGDPSMLEQVFVNLLSNAVKFTRERDPAIIEVGTLDKDGERVFFVRDNGIGFDMNHASRLFGLFTRIHGDSSYEGTGVGLSIVHNIVGRHGGRIWAESVPGAGATFFFTLGAGAGS
jgi:light-regulated signal transduction histidine kinase (bacteriophytochrome)